MGLRINPYRRSVTPYRVPIPVPPCDPDFQPVEVSVSCQWLSYIVGALAILTEQATWDTTDPDIMLEAIQRANNLREIFSAAIDAAACSDFNIPISCRFDFTSSAGSWIVDPTFNQGVYVGGSGFVSTHVSSVSEQAVAIIDTFSEPTAVTAIQAIINAPSGGSGTNNVVAFFSYVGGVGTLLAQFNLEATVEGTYIWHGQTQLVDAIEIQCNSGTTAASFVVERVDFAGLSSDSFTC